MRTFPSRSTHYKKSVRIARIGMITWEGPCKRQDPTLKKRKSEVGSIIALAAR